MAWRARLKHHADPSVLLFAHEWSHARHRDVLWLRLHSAYGNWLTLAVFLTRGLVVGAFSDVADAVAPAGLVLVTATILVMRRVRRAIVLLQELRADAEAYEHDGPVAFAAALAALPTADTWQRRQRLAALTDSGHRHLVRRTTLLLWVGWSGYVAVVVVGTLAASAVMLANGPDAVLSTLP